MPAGRPTKYKPEYCETVIEFGMEGYSITEMAREIGVNKDTIYEWSHVHQEFSVALKTAVDYSEAWWAKVGRTGLNNKDLNVPVWIFNMKARFGWRDKPAEDEKDDDTHVNAVELATRIVGIITAAGSAGAEQAGQPDNVDTKPKRRGRPPKSATAGP